MASCTTAAAAAAAFSLPNLSYRTGSDGVQRHGKRRRRQVSFALPSSSSNGDLQFLRQGLRWVKSSPHFSGLSTTVSRTFWLRFLEDPGASSSSPFPIPPLPSPSYPGLSGMDLLMSDLEALKLYAFHLHQLTKIWSMPLPETYDPQIIAFYFSCRPHVLVFRVLEFNKIGLEEDEISNSSDYYIGHLLKETMLNLGPTFIKVGQSLSTRPDIMGSEISKALSELNENIPPFPREVAIDIIEQELGSPVETIFSHISEKPIASASFGQVYRGCTLDGCDVAVKLGVLRKVAKRKSDLCLYADELGKGLVGELDYTIEAVNASEFRVAHARFSFISVPKVYGHLSKKRVLTMEWMAGENPSELLFMSQDPGHQVVGNLPRQKLEARKRLLDLINKGVEASLVQLLETGLLHADPHTGNLRYTNEGHIGFLDFGLLCRMEKKHQFAFLAFIVHIINGDWGAVVHDLTEMDVVRPGPNLFRVTMVLGKIWSIALKYHFRMPPYYTLVLRSLASLEGLAVTADPDFMTFQAACPYVVHKLFSDNSVPMRRILHSAVFNKRKEFEWERLAMYLKIGSTRWEWGRVKNEDMNLALRRVGVKGVEVKKSDELDQISALIIPGGESTTMSKLAHYHNLVCSLSSSSSSSLMLQSFETELHVPKLAAKVGGPTSFRGVFIRAPAILEAGPCVEILADYPVSSDKSSTLVSSDGTQQEEAGSQEKVIVAVKQGNLLATAFHPELTSDTRWHSFFLKMMEDNGVQSSFGDSTTEEALHEQQKGRSNDLPVFEWQGW
ncbi:hypothetical protein QJS04_geneDACA015361 [Acorus gramineus]|uniref:ABC1 atypical kinase-like domain-containing protein n=1 Tax=Acorus gramineus TaxID=55184 RepID=A0AAV9AR55_ACOGR|nr:hypothetical protein QJS04_geneDACA015361 [Acorus gramineus]